MLHTAMHELKEMPFLTMFKVDNTAALAVSGTAVKSSAKNNDYEWRRQASISSSNDRASPASVPTEAMVANRRGAVRRRACGACGVGQE